jgi:glycogen synthase kinase 3 beta
MLKGDFLMKVMGNYSTFEEGGQILNIVMAYYEGDLYSLIKQNGKKGLTNMDIKILSYQIFRGLLSIHQLKIAHRDIKPHNILYKTKKLAICDFGSAKILTN